jgi:hypothetical protein
MRIDIPHSLGAAEARRRIDGAKDKLAAKLPSGATVTHAWTGDRLDMNVTALGQEVAAAIHVGEAVVGVELTLPPALAFFGQAIEAKVRGAGTDLLEDKSKRG